MSTVDAIRDVAMVNEFINSWHRAPTPEYREGMAANYRQHLDRSRTCLQMDHLVRIADLEDQVRTPPGEKAAATEVITAAFGAAASAIEKAISLLAAAQGIPTHGAAQNMLAAAQVQATLAVAYATLATR